MAENNKNDPVVVEEEPVVDVEGDNASASSEARNKNIKYIVTAISIVVSVLAYVFVFSSSDKKDVTVDNTAIVKEEKTVGRVNSSPTIDNIDSLADIGYRGDVFVNNEKEALELPELPELPSTLSKSISDEIEETKKIRQETSGFSKNEVDNMINDRLRGFENEMNRLRDESKKLALELEKKKKEEEEAKKKIKIPIFGTDNSSPNNTTAPIAPADNGGTSNEISADAVAAIEDKKKEEERELQIAQRRRIVQERQGAPMFKMQGGGGGKKDNEDENSIIILDKDSLNKVKEKKIDSVTTKTSDMSRVIMQGKIISAILETAINTDVNTQVRAIVSRDVYSESGKNIVIPKGSKIIGNFQMLTNNNIARIQVVWTRIIRVDGLSINITANSADSLGRGGVEGDLDNKYVQIMQNAFLSSLITVGSAILVEKATGVANSVTTQTSTGLVGSTTTTTSTPTSEAITKATESFTKEVQGIVDGLKEGKPTIRVAQGTKINIIVNQDMTLPIYKQSK